MLKFKKVLLTAYYQDFVDTLDFSIKTLEQAYKKGLLEGKHMHKGRVIFYLSEKGLKLLYKEGCL